LPFIENPDVVDDKLNYDGFASSKLNFRPKRGSTFLRILRPWNWPLYLLIPFLIISCVGLGIVIWLIFESNPMQGTRVPKLNKPFFRRLFNSLPFVNTKSYKQRV